MRLTLERLSKQFKNRIAVENVNAELTEGIYGFLGANGAGKTTTVKLLNGMLTPRRGSAGCWAQIRRWNRKRYMQSREWSRSTHGCMRT